VRGFVAGLVLIPMLVIAVLSIRPGGLRQQLRLAGRRFRIALTLLAAYFLCTGFIRFLAPSGPVSDYGPPVVAVILAAVYLVLAQDPPSEPASRT
jgi:hypothetical protein